MICFPNAKINIGLNIVEKRSNGFHNIETVFYPVQWCDVLEVIQNSEFRIQNSGIEIPNDGKEFPFEVPNTEKFLLRLQSVKRSSFSVGMDWIWYPEFLGRLKATQYLASSSVPT